MRLDHLTDDVLAFEKNSTHIVYKNGNQSITFEHKCFSFRIRYREGLRTSIHIMPDKSMPSLQLDILHLYIPSNTVYTFYDGISRSIVFSTQLSALDYVKKASSESTYLFFEKALHILNELCFKENKEV